MDFFISDALAAAPQGQGDPLMSFLPLIFIFVVFYFLLIRPQQKRMKEHREMLSNIRRGDRVVTGGGIIGTVTKAGDDELTVEIGENVKVKVVRSTVQTVLAKTEPSKGKTAESDDEEDEDSGGSTQAAAPAEKKGLGGLLSRK
jgi:preprotein translocase subunit YajC